MRTQLRSRFAQDWKSVGLALPSYLNAFGKRPPMEGMYASAEHLESGEQSKQSLLSSDLLLSYPGKHSYLMHLPQLQEAISFLS